MTFWDRVVKSSWKYSQWGFSLNGYFYNVAETGWHVRLSHKQRYTIMVTNCGTRYYSSVSYSLWVISNYMINSFNLVVTKSQNLEQLKYAVKITAVLSCPPYTVLKSQHLQLHIF